MELDRTDRRILAELQNNGRISNQELADKIGLSPSPCLRRVRQLEEAGIVESYVARLNASKLGLKLIALIQISMDKHTPERFEHFEKVVNDYPEVLECLLITGQSADYLLKVAVQDMEVYQDFLLNKITRIPGVSDVHSSFVLREVINTTRLPLSGVTGSE
ncbi:MAG: AsnC family transcriptional regulator [Gammaproteobacteria bacterium]|nr:AsnC family transcriptional regulator [Gammaproteobacteria bacterium]MAY02794.1 AsnC family transcriptional regulator [Gammaproteobacteria bacterium]|tara:strand:+ start:1183 stop:1665 length:483 start_codon:yes stop_codon:yes gene_type:complete